MYKDYHIFLKKTIVFAKMIVNIVIIEFNFMHNSFDFSIVYSLTSFALKSNKSSATISKYNNYDLVRA